MQGRLNIIQKSMVQWNALHPYNAVHVVRMGGACAPARLEACIHRTLEHQGLICVALDAAGGRFHYEESTAPGEVRTLAGTDEPRRTVVAEMERELNLPFPVAQPFSPFRFWIVPAGESFYLGVSYFHPVADAESLIMLLRLIVEAYGEEGGSGGRRLDRYPDARALRLRRHPVVVARKCLRVPAQLRRLRRSHRPHYRQGAGMGNGFVTFAAGAEDLGALVAAARSWEVTVNDVLMAVLLQSLAPCASARAEAARRRKLSIGCIVNVRHDLAVDRHAFGLFLGSFTVTHAVPPGIGLRELAVEVRQQTGPIKRHKLYLAMPLELGVARFMLRFFSPERRGRFFAKHFPLWGGITNLNLNRIWEPQSRLAPLDYLRGVSTGPVTPLVLSVTTVGDRLNFGVSYRTAAFSSNDVEAFVSRYQEQLASAGGCA